MLDLLEVISWIGEWFLSWRLFLSLAITAGIIFLIFAITPDQTVRWVLCTPIALAGVIIGFRWQIKSDTI